jgi:dTDP-glucose 4,6-dehydratase
MKQRLLLTGATGFIGKELYQRLGKYDVYTLERYVTGRYNHYDSNNKIFLDLRNYEDIKSTIREINPAYVIHLAAISPVAFSYEHYYEVSEVNYQASVNLIEACHEYADNLKQFIFAGTSEEYGQALKDRNHKLSEDSELIPNSPYAVSKVAVDKYLQYMGMAFDFPFTILRPFNTYGRTDNNHFFMERTIKAMQSNEPLKLGIPDSVRDWMFVEDHIYGYLQALGNRKAIKQIINLCTGKGYSTKETAKIIAEMTNYKLPIKWNAIKPRPSDAKILIGDNSKAQKLLNWKPKYSLEEGLNKMIYG